MKVLIIGRLRKTPEEEAAVASALRTLKARADDGVTVQRDEELDWDRLRQTEESYNGAYRWVAQNFDCIIAIEAPGGVLAKGQTSIVEYALAAGTPVNVWREGRGHKVQAVEVLPNADWKTGYAWAVLS